MKPLKKFDEDFFSDILEKYPWLTFVGYTAFAIVGVWVLGKSAKMLADATLNFKALHKAMKS